MCFQPCCNIPWLLSTLFLTSWKCKWYFLCFFTNDVNGSSRNLVGQLPFSLPDHLHISSSLLRYDQRNWSWICVINNINYYWYRVQKIVKFNYWRVCKINMQMNIFYWVNKLLLLRKCRYWGRGAFITNKINGLKMNGIIMWKQYKFQYAINLLHSSIILLQMKLPRTYNIFCKKNSFMILQIL